MAAEADVARWSECTSSSFHLERIAGDHHSVLGAGVNENYAGNGAELTAQDGKAAGIQPGGPAAQAGLRAGDVVVSFGGLPVSTAYGLMDAVRSQAPGTKVKVGFEREGQRHTTELTLGSAGA